MPLTLLRPTRPRPVARPAGALLPVLVVLVGAQGCDRGASDPPPPPPPPAAASPKAAPASPRGGAGPVPGFPSFPGGGSPGAPTPSGRGTVAASPETSEPPGAGTPATPEVAPPEPAVPKAASGTDETAAPPTSRRPLAVGQWTKHRVTEASGRVSEMVYRVVDQEGGAHWVAVKMDQTELRMLISLGPGPADFDLRAVDIAGQRLEGAALAGVRRMVGDGLASAIGVGDWGGRPRESVTTRAGTFQAFKGRHRTAIGPMNASGVAWHHPSVPISGLVKAVDDDGGRIELIAFGE